ncbi:MAG TPA: MerR family transcriptional regulator [Silvibacterium sp.]|nr:MerR family transcriptional regulator [Silvibacterium sp.]
MNAEKPLRSGDLARLTGVSPDTIRHYERMGILPILPRTSAGYRIYDRAMIDRVQMVRRAMQLGFTLSELSEILSVRDSGGVPCHRVLSLTEEKLHSLESQIEELQRTRLHMRQFIRQWRKKLMQTKPGSKAMLLHSLAEISAVAGSTNDFKRRKRR